MKLYIFLLSFILLACELKNENKKENVYKNLKSKFIDDENTFEQFLFLGRCRCQDRLSKKPVSYHDAKYTNAIGRLAFMNNPLMHLVDTDNLGVYFDQYIDSIYLVKLKKFEDKNLEAGSYDYSLDVVCADIFQDNIVIRAKYYIFMSDLKNYRRKDMLIDYLNDKSTLKSSEEW